MDSERDPVDQKICDAMCRAYDRAIAKLQSMGPDYVRESRRESLDIIDRLRILFLEGPEPEATAMSIALSGFMVALADEPEDSDGN